MLFAYTYVPHQMEKMQEFIDYIFYEVWCKATPKTVFSFELCSGNPELFDIMKKFFYSDKKNADFFYGNVERIYSHFAHLKLKHIRRLKWWYFSNNNIERICSNNPTLQLARYTDIEKRYPDLAKDLRIFFTGLYDFDSADVKAKVGHIDDHYQAFVSTNTAGKCPFCGINDIKGAHHSKREAYDHYLPKALYPFNSINFRNLAPACHECNSTYKLSKDPAHNLAGRRKAFYPFAAAAQIIDIQVALQHSDIENLKPTDVQMQFGPAAITEEIETWKDVYGIEERYKAKLCGKYDGKYWITQVLDEWKDDDRDPEEILGVINRNAERKPFADNNFLRKPFLDACKSLGLFDGI
ncbi:hypothetical protein [Thiomicrorhabdus sp.]|uniref:HNH endonuclease n=1 Tax=Thiomicrorhabdus sp. TaxID=2039724 RepID=UPI0029C8AC2B|nr:hypothetical protein [Thiomicrorhabdus sp.]